MHDFDHWCSEVGDSFDFIGLQEVSQTSKLQVVREFGHEVFQYLLTDFDELRDYTAIGTSSCSSYLGQMILLHTERVNIVHSAWRGERVLAVELEIASLNHRFIVVSCHLPHADNSDESFQDSLRELVQLVAQNPRTPIILLGDFNCAPGSDRAVELFSAMQNRGSKIFRTFQTTRWGRCSETEIDYFICNKAFQHCTLAEEGSIKASASPLSRIELGSDHCCISLTVALQDPHAASVEPSLPRKRFHATNCKRWNVSPGLLQQKLTECIDDFKGADLHGQWEILTRTAKAVSFPRTSLKFIDSPMLKGLCLRRRMRINPEERAQITRQIIAMRHLEKTTWLQSLHQRSQQGDHQAIKYLRQRFAATKGDIGDFVKREGGLDHAAATLKQHYETLFGPEIPQDHRTAILQAEATFRARSEEKPSSAFTQHEIDLAMQRLKLNKTSGPSGISNEYLLSLWRCNEGRCMLVDFLNGLLCSDELPRELHRAQVVLIPKLACISKPGDYRPTYLIESLHKVFSWLLVNRLSSSWETPSMQMAGVRGRQVCDALLSAQYRVLRDSKEQQYDLYLSCDVQSAFDSLNHETIAHFLLRHCPCHQGREALQMLRLLVSPELCFYWRGHCWQTEQSSGVQQGGSHSAAIFAYILGLACQQLETTWMSEGETTRHTTFSLLFMDDLLISFGGWSQALRLTKRLQQTLAELGLQLNPKKTCLMSHPSVLELGQQYPFPDDCLLNHISWVTECVYLRKPLAHFQVGAAARGDNSADVSSILTSSAGKATHLAFESLQRCMRKGHWGCASDTVLLCNTYLGSTWFWYSPLIEPLTKYVSKMRTMQTTFLSLMLGLYIPATVSSHAALLLHRLRRRLVLVLLNHMPSRQWTVI